MYYSGDEFADDDCTSGPADFDEYPYAFDWHTDDESEDLDDERRA